MVNPSHVTSIAGIPVLLDTLIDDAHCLSLFGHRGQESVSIRQDNIELVFAQGVFTFCLFTMELLERNLTSMIEDERGLYKTISTN